MSLAHFALVALIFALIMLPRVFAIHYEPTNKAEEYDYR